MPRARLLGLNRRCPVVTLEDDPTAGPARRGGEQREAPFCHKPDLQNTRRRFSSKGQGTGERLAKGKEP